MAIEADASIHTEASPKRGPELQYKAKEVGTAAAASTNGGKSSILSDNGNESASSMVSSRSGHASDEEREEGEIDKDEQPSPLPTGQQPPPLPVGEEPPPLPDEALPDDGWEAVWDGTHQAYYFYNRKTNLTTWENPRVSETNATLGEEAPAVPVAGRYNPAIHGDYDPDADYAIQARAQEEAAVAAVNAQAQALQPQANPDYAATGAFNRFTGKWQSADEGPDRHNDESKSKRQMNAFFDVDAAANSHGGRSLKAERQNKKLSKSELKAFKEKRRERKEEKRRAWLRD